MNGKTLKTVPEKTMTGIRGKVWSGTKEVELIGRIVPFNNAVAIFNHGRKWWLFYSSARLTGAFPTKTKAMAWFNHGGR